jgi:hypothetical protein
MSITNRVALVVKDKKYKELLRFLAKKLTVPVNSAEKCSTHIWHTLSKYHHGNVDEIVVDISAYAGGDAASILALIEYGQKSYKVKSIDGTVCTNDEFMSK